MNTNSNKIICRNKKAFYEYEIKETFEAGVALQGTEVKSIREGKINLEDGWVEITEGEEAILRQVHITPYHHGNIFNHPERRPRKLLLKKKELRHLAEEVNTKGWTVVPLKVYIKGQRIKLEVGLARGKKDFDKRESTKEREANREIERAMKK
jgi:SsrA-binding protein